MTNNTEPTKTAGHKDELVGSIKSTVGKAVGNDELRTKGDLQNSEGTAQVNAAAAKQKAEAAVSGAKGSVKSAVGSVTGNDRLYAEGQVDKARA